MNDVENKKSLIEEIKMLIATSKETIEIHPNYLEYFEVEELENIKDELVEKKENVEQSTKEYIDEVYNKLI